MRESHVSDGPPSKIRPMADTEGFLFRLVAPREAPIWIFRRFPPSRPPVLATSRSRGPDRVGPRSPTAKPILAMGKNDRRTRSMVSLRSVEGFKPFSTKHKNRTAAPRVEMLFWKLVRLRFGFGSKKSFEFGVQKAPAPGLFPYRYRQLNGLGGNIFAANRVVFLCMVQPGLCLTNTRSCGQRFFFHPNRASQTRQNDLCVLSRLWGEEA